MKEKQNTEFVEFLVLAFDCYIFIHFEQTQ